MVTHNRRPARIFSDWLDKTIEEGPEGKKLASGKELAAQFGISPKTVQRILEKYRNEGKICRIRKRGTYVGKPARNAVESPSHTPQSSAISAVYESIAQGYFKLGTVLPSIKYFCIRFKCSATTVSQAYRQLEKQGYITRIGKSYWVGANLESIEKSASAFSVYIFNPFTYDLKYLFNESPLAQVYRTMEQILYDAGAVIYHKSADDFEKVIRDLQHRNRMPWGLVFLGADDKRFRQYMPPLKRYLQACRPSSPRVVVDWVLGDYSIWPPGTWMINRGSVLTSVCRLLTRFIIENNFRHVVCCGRHPGSLWGFDRIIWPMIKMRTELSAAAPQTELKFVVGTDRTHASFDSWIQPYASRINKMQLLMDKYGKTPVDALKRQIKFTTKEPLFPLSPETDLLIFMQSADAARACVEARNKKIAIPGDISILCLEDDPAYYHEGISICVPDYSRIGYMLAHAVLGDIPVAKTSKGFIKTYGKLTQKLTTRSQ